MNTVTATRLLSVDPARVWAEIADLRTVEKWHPTVQSVDLLSEHPTGLGAVRRCNFKDGSSVREEVTALEEGRRLHLQLSEFSMPMKRFEGELEVKPAPEGSQVVFTLSYEMKYGVLGSAMNALMVRGQMSKLMDSVLAGLDRYLVAESVAA